MRLRETLDAAMLDQVYGGFRWEDLPESNNVEDRRFDPPGTEYPETPVPPNAIVPPGDPLATALGRDDIPQLGRRGGGAPMRGLDDDLGSSGQGADDGWSGNDQWSANDQSSFNGFAMDGGYSDDGAGWTGDGGAGWTGAEAAGEAFDNGE